MNALTNFDLIRELQRLSAWKSLSKSGFFAGTIMILLAATYAIGESAEETSSTLVPSVLYGDPSAVLDNDFMGFGIEFEYEGDHNEMNVDNATWKAHWPEVCKRIDFMRPAIMRTMHNPLMYTRLEGDRVVPDYASRRMDVMYMVLDYAKRRNIPLVFGDWYLPTSYYKATDGVDHSLNTRTWGATSSPLWAEGILVPFLRYLVNERGYTNICYVNMLNEPASQLTVNGDSLNFEEWKKVILNLHSALAAQGLENKLKIVGTDGPGDFAGWISKTAQDSDLRRVIGAYEYHLYAHLNTDKWLPSLLEGKLETGELLPRRKIIDMYDPEGPSKPFFMAEAGIDDGNSGDTQVNRTKFSYGVWMADYAIQSIRSGMAGLIAWDADDAMHTYGTYGQEGLKGWGFWNSLAGDFGYPASDFNIRPWFYTWSLMSRLFPHGCKTFTVQDTGNNFCRVAAARLPGQNQFSIAVVNESETPIHFALKMPSAESQTITEYRYFENERPVDLNGFPIPACVHKDAVFASGVEVSLPGQGVVFLTSQAPDNMGSN